MNQQQVLEMRTDMKLLLECLDYQKDNPSAMKQALMTLASSLQGCSESKDEFRECGGLHQVLETVMISKSAEVSEAGLFCLGNAVESNVYSQKLLSTAVVFTYLHSVLSEQRGGSVRKKQTASFLLLCLVSNNGFGQNLMRQSTCLNDIITLIRSSLPKNTKANSELFDGTGGISIALWSTLVSTACLCVNNPQNEENQRICSSLFPYLFSLLQHQTDNRITKPILSLVGLTVSNNVQNQERVRKCGGLDLLVKKLGSFQKSLEERPETMATVIQLLNTLDAIITENEANSQRFGSLGGVRLVINLLSHFPLNDHNKTQAVLTLAHAVDICNTNQQYITDSSGMAVLIQQLTVTEDQELSKTIKYLLHICVATGKPEDCEHVSDSNVPLPREERMKRHQEMEVLKKINDLDEKLKAMENEKLRKKNVGDQDIIPEQQVRPLSDIMSPQSDRTSSVAFGRSACGFHHGEQTTECQLATPREQSLLDQLVQEKVERQRLEQLNKMLQENMYMRNMLFSRQSDNMPGQMQDQLRNFIMPNNNEGIDLDRNNSATTRSGKKYYQSKQVCQSTEPDEDSPSTGCEDEPKLQVSQQQGILTRRAARREQKDRDCQVVSQHYSNTFSDQTCKKNTNSRGRTYVNRSDIADMPSPTHENAEISSPSTCPLDLSAKTSNRSTVVKQAVRTANNTVASKTDLPSLKKQSNRHAEIQCGTPYVVCTNAETETMTEKTAALVNRTEPEATKKNKQTNMSLSTSITTKKSSEFKNSNIEYANNVILKTPVVIISDINKNKDFPKQSNVSTKTSTDTANQATSSSSANQKRTLCNDEENKIRESRDFDRVSMDSTEIFVKPNIIPQRSKVRVTPSLGVGIAPKPATFVKPKPQSGGASPSNMSMCSEFDRNLIHNLRNRAPTVIRKPPQIAPVSKQQRTYVTPVIKSQNNVKKLDQHLQRSTQNAAEDWKAVPFTPQQQGILLPRPAFSDCGMRRPVLDSPYSVKSVGRLNKQCRDDSGFESPDLLRSVNSDTSSVDSNIEGFRSGSDTEEDNEEPSITAGVLRSGKRKAERSVRKRKKVSKQKCPETNPYTCKYHRRVRRTEREYIQTVKTAVKGRQTRKLLQKSLKKKLGQSQEKTSVYNFTVNSDVDCMSLSLDDEQETGLCLPQRAKLRRRRIPYTDEEEFNLMEGVRRMGKSWNQILLTYKFHPSRTNVDLKDKHKRMLLAEQKDMSTQPSTSKKKPNLVPFSMCEERRLRRGVKRCGYNWKIILQSFTFAKGRTTEDLRNRWRSIHRKK